MAFKDIFRGSQTSVRKSFFDNFNRANQSTISPASDGSLWQSVRGAFSIFGSRASSGGDTNYPMSVIDMGTNNVSVSIGEAYQGSTAALWVTDSGNWWAVGIDQDASSPYSCGCTVTQAVNYNSSCSTYGTVCNAYQCNAYSPGNCASYTCNAYQCNAYSGGNCNSYSVLSCITYSCNAYSQVCNGYNTSTCANSYYSPTNKKSACTGWNGSNCKAYSPSCNSSTCTSWYAQCNSSNSVVCDSTSCSSTTCNATNSATCSTYGCSTYGTQCNAYQTDGPFYSYVNSNCSTCYPQYIRVIKSVSSVVTEVASWIFTEAIDTINTKIIGSFKASTSGESITIKPYSDSNFVTQIGQDLVYTASGASFAPRFGISVKPSTYGQQDSIGSIDITRN